MRKILNRLAARGRRYLRSKFFRITGPDGGPYIDRWYLIKTKRFEVLLHKIMASDPDRDLHDHPWAFVSFLLVGQGYMEHQPDGSKRYFPPFSVNYRPDPAKPHRLELPKVSGFRETEAQQWTILITGPRRRTWGFHVPDHRRFIYTDGSPEEPEPSAYMDRHRWIPYRDYLDVKFGVGEWDEGPAIERKPVGA